MGGSASIIQPPSTLGGEFYSQFQKDKAPHFVLSPGDVKPIVFAAKGAGSIEECPTDTIVNVFRGLLKNSTKANSIALRVERGLKALGKGEKPEPAFKACDLTTWTFQEYYNDVINVASCLIHYEFKPHDSVCVYGFNAPEWHIGAMAGIFAGGCFTGIYPSDTPDQIHYKVKLSNSSFAFVENKKCGDNILLNAENSPYLKAIIYWGTDMPKNSAPHVRADGSKIHLITMEECKEIGLKMDKEILEKAISAIKPTDCCDLIFTSGTTGNPKAVMISHDNVIFEASTVYSMLKAETNIEMHHRGLSYLPLSHIAGSLTDIFVPLMMTAKMQSDHYTITFARNYDLKIGTLKDRLILTEPTIFMGVPRVWEKIHEGLMKVGANVKGVKRSLADWAKSKGLKYTQEQQIGGSGKLPRGFKQADKLILSKIKAALGLHKCIAGFTGAAPIKLETLQYFGSLNIMINELYGMSETTGGATVNTPKRFLWGSCGYPMDGVEVEIFNVDPNDVNNKTQCPRAENIFRPNPENEGEICFRGRNIMMGYMANPIFGDEHMAEMAKKNKDVIDEDGWLHSGDKGCKGVNNMVRITGRFKELIIGAGGENIAPVPIEDNISKECPLISNIMMVGDKRKFNIALISLKAKGATGELPGSDDLDQSCLGVINSETTKISQAMDDEMWIKEITRAIVATNKNGAVCPSNASTIQKFTIIPHDFSIEGGELTATLKLKRSVAEEKYSGVIEDMYSEANVKNNYVKFKGFDAYK